MLRRFIIYIISVSLFVMSAGSDYLPARAALSSIDALRPVATSVSNPLLFRENALNEIFLRLERAFKPDEKANIFAEITELDIPKELNVAIESEATEQINISIPFLDDFHLRILLFESMFYWLKLKGLFAVNINFKELKNKEVILGELASIWAINGFEYNPEQDFPFQLIETELQKKAQTLIDETQQNPENIYKGDIENFRAHNLPKVHSGENVKILLISSSARDDVVVTNRREGRLISPNFGHHRLKSHLEMSEDAEVDVFNPEVYANPDIAIRMLVSKMLSREYHVVGFSPTHSNLIDDLRMAWFLKKLDGQIPDNESPIFITGGNETTYDAKRLLSHAPFDVAVIGYGEKVLEDLIRAILCSKERKLSSILKDIDGVAYINEKGHFVFRDPAPISTEDFRKYDYSNMPFDNMPYRMHWVHNAMALSPSNVNTREASLRCARMFFTTHCAKGVPCGFCTSRLIPNQPLLGLSGKEMAELIRRVAEIHEAESVYINDDDVMMGGSRAGKARFRDFCNEVLRLKGEGLIPENFIFHMQTRSKSFLMKDKVTNKYKADIELINLAKSTGFAVIALGVESFSDRLLMAPSIDKATPAEYKALQSAGMTVSEVHLIAIEGLLKGGLRPQVNLIGLPPESTIDDLIVNTEIAVDVAIKGAQLALTTYVWYLPGANLAKIEEYRKDSVELSLVIIPGTRIYYPYCNRYIPMDPDIRRITEVGNIWSTADNIWKELLEAVKKEDLSVTVKNPPLQVRVLTIFSSELELLAELLLEDGSREQTRGLLLEQSDRAREECLRFIREELATKHSFVETQKALSAEKIIDHNAQKLGYPMGITMVIDRAA